MTEQDAKVECTPDHIHKPFQTSHGRFVKKSNLKGLVQLREIWEILNRRDTALRVFNDRSMISREGLLNESLHVRILEWGLQHASVHDKLKVLCPNPNLCEQVLGLVSWDVEPYSLSEAWLTSTLDWTKEAFYKVQDCLKDIPWLATHPWVLNQDNQLLKFLA